MRKSEEDDFGAFVASRMDRWRRTAYLFSHDWHTADDIVSITVGRLYRHWHKVSQARNPDAYAQRVLTHSWLDECRRPWAREQSQAELPETPWLPTDQVVDRESLARLLESLAPRQRTVLVLRFYLGYTLDETAELLGVSVGTVKSQSSRGLETLRTLPSSFGS